MNNHSIFGTHDHAPLRTNCINFGDRSTLISKFQLFQIMAAYLQNIPISEKKEKNPKYSRGSCMTLQNKQNPFCCY